MKEELIIIGKNNHHVSPELDLWGWPIAIYLFLGGLAAGALFFASYFYLRGKEDEYSAIVKWAPCIVPLALIVGLALLFYDLHAKINVWRLYATLRLESPMSWGAWTLLVITPLSILWILPYLSERMLVFSDKVNFFIKLNRWINKNRRSLAFMILPLSVALGIYTGILLSAFNARPLWNTSILAVLFLVSGLSTGLVISMFTSSNKKEKKTLAILDIALIIVELILMVHFIMGMLSGPQIQQLSIMAVIAGDYSWQFWGLFVGLGLLIPLTMEILELRGLKFPKFLAPTLVLAGGLIFRLVIIYAGQATSYSYLLGG